MQPAAQQLLVEVRTQFPDSGTLHLRFAQWTPGSYKIRDYARHIFDVRVWVADSPATWTKADLSRYRLTGAPGASVRIQFGLMATDDSVRGAWLDPWRGHADGAAILPCVEEYASAPLKLELRPPEPVGDWAVVTALPAAGDNAASGWGWYQAANWRDLIDHPLLWGPIQTFRFTVAGCEHVFSIVGLGERTFDVQRLERDCARICGTQIDAMGGSPNALYHFLLRLSPSAPGGLEHLESTLLAAQAESLPQADADSNRAYENLLGLISHEYFHLWNVKRLRPQAVSDSDLSAPAPFADLWAYEGVTSYLDDWFLRQSDTRSIEDYLRVLAESMTRLERTPGRFRQSLVESSQDAWIRLYQPESHLPLSTVSYYLKGSLVALAIDLQLRLSSGGEWDLISVLADWFQTLGPDGAALSEHALEARLHAVCPAPELADLIQRCVHGREDPDLQPLLAAVGLDARRRAAVSLTDAGGVSVLPRHSAWLGLRPDPTTPMRIVLVEPESPARAVGIVNGVEMIGLNGQRYSQDALERVLRLTAPGQPVQLEWLHDGFLRTAEVALAAPPADRWEVRWLADVAPDVAQRRARWLGVRTT